MVASAPLVPLPTQPADVPWPTRDWPDGGLPAHVDRARLARVVDDAFAADAETRLGITHALLVVHGGRLVLEHYGDGLRADQTLRSWSIAKSMLHALAGVLVRAGALDVRATPEAPEWATPGDPRAAITIDQLLRMSSGLTWVEDYVDRGLSHVIDMLYGAGKADMAAYAAGLTLAAPPDTVFNYSSGSTNILARLVGGRVGGTRDAMRAFMDRALFAPLGMRSALPKFDGAGTFVGSSFVFATARDFARFGLLYLRGGVWEGQELLPPGWVDYARTPTRTAPLGDYGAHFWIHPGSFGAFAAHGFEGQRVLIVPALDLVVVRLGRTPAALVDGVTALLAGIVASFAPRGSVA